MPAIQPSRLRQQVARLGDLFEQPDRFLPSLHDLYDFYANRAHRSTQGAAARTLLPRFLVPHAVTQQVENELEPRCQANPLVTLALADRLWADPYLEVRLLAVYLLGEVPLNPPDPVIQRLLAWIQPDDDVQLLAALFDRGANQVRNKLPAVWWNQVKTWSSNPDPHLQSLGLRALVEMVADKNYHELPAVLTLISPIFYTATVNLEVELLA
jgi:hypothetical protein